MALRNVDPLTIVEEDGAIILLTRSAVRSRLRGAFGRRGDHRIVDELIAERRAEAARDLAESKRLSHPPGDCAQARPPLPCGDALSRGAKET